MLGCWEAGRLGRRVGVGALALLSLIVAGVGFAAASVRVKDVARVDGVRKNQLIGYGIVVGLNGTGDSTTSMQVTPQTMASLLERLGVSVPRAGLKAKNVAAVIVTAELPAFSRAGQRVDVTISSLGDAKSLQGGTLLLTPLRAPNGDVYAAAQGPLSVGGFAAGAAGASVQKNHPTAGRVPEGALLERDAPLPVLNRDHLDLVLERADFTTSARMAAAINEALGDGVAQALDAGRVRVGLSPKETENPVEFLASLEAVTLEPDHAARVVVDEKNGTVVLGRNVKVRPVAISHGSLTVQITPRLEVSQPPPLSAKGTTVARDQAAVTVSEPPGHVVLFDQGDSLESLVKALNALGVSSRDLVMIFQSLKAAGALEAEIEIL
ncbi:MAG: flagellar basal body P-ring protein FlgI [Deltaproteobacteria bacterium]|nr:flagellar basal body P-ring protein FlgI [Deltaproteobacteria bacterium]